LASFSSSVEFSRLAESYGIVAYDNADSPPVTSGNPVDDFVSRFYTEVLGRAPDSDGLNHWANQLKSNASTADDIANGFFFSQEFINQNTSNNEFVNIAYKTLLGRDADRAGLDNWESHLANGMSRSDMLDGFIYSQEFDALANKYGINVGEPELPEEPLVEATPWDKLVGEYEIYAIDLTSPEGSEFHISHSDILSIGNRFDSALNISSDGEFYMYISTDGEYEEVDAQIMSVSAAEIYLYSSELNEYETLDYVLNGDNLNLSFYESGATMSMDWYLL